MRRPCRSVKYGKKHLYDFEAILEVIHPFGPWQWMQQILLFLPSIGGGIAVLVFAFVGFIPHYRCSIPNCEDIAYYSSGNTFAEYVELGIPHDDSKIESVGAKCQRRVFPEQQLSCEEYISQLKTNPNASEIETCSHEDLLYDHSIVNSSIIQDYEFTCDRNFVRYIFNSLYMVGMLLGAAFFGWIGDHYGRKNSLLLACIFTIFSGFVAAFVKSEVIYGILRITVGMGGMGLYLISFIMAIECSTTDYHVAIGLFQGIGFGVGEALFTWMAYNYRDWFPLQLLAHIPMVLILISIFFVPESTRWLIARGRNEEALEQVKFAAKMNRREIPLELLPKDVDHYESEKDEDANEDIKQGQVKDLFVTRQMGFRTVDMFFQWFSVTIGYFGLTFVSTSFHGDPYTNIVLQTLAAEVSVIFLFFGLDNLGRRPCLIICQLVAGVACISSGLLTEYEEWSTLQKILALIGKLASSAGFSVVYFFTGELYPTHLRSIAVGSCSSFARVGGIIALLIGALDKFWKPAPMVIMGCVGTIAGFLAFYFPETMGEDLPETTKESLEIGRDSKGRCCAPRCIMPYLFRPSKRYTFKEKTGSDTT